MNKTHVIFMPSHVGRKYFMENNLRTDLKVLDLANDVSKYMNITRKRTKEELDEIIRQLEDAGCPIDPKEYIEVIKNDLITEPNLQYPYNYINEIEYNIGMYDIIFANYTKDNVRILSAIKDHSPNDTPFEIILVYPDNEIMHEYIGRMVVCGEDFNVVKLKIKSWDKWISNIVELSKTHKSYALKSKEYLTDVINKLF